MGNKFMIYQLRAYMVDKTCNLVINPAKHDRTVSKLIQWRLQFSVTKYINLFDFWFGWDASVQGYSAWPWQRRLRAPTASWCGGPSPKKKINIIRVDPKIHVSDIKLIRTDTTLDLSREAEKGMLCRITLSLVLLVECPYVATGFWNIFVELYKHNDCLISHVEII